MKKVFLMMMLLISLFFTLPTYARQSGGGGGGDDLKGVCELAGGSWTGSESSGTWACCWADWGCYGCINNVCKMQCRTARCRRANSARQISNQQKTVDSLAPQGMKAPVIPKNAKPAKASATLRQ